MIKYQSRLNILLMAPSSHYNSIFRISIIGDGKVGSAAAFDILKDHIDDVILIDLYADLAKGEALDMMQAAPAIEFDGKITGTGDFQAMQGSELVIVMPGQA